ncbi:hypothetical protein ABZ527_33430 [Streptomyces griseofuscus]|uniref:hypothetical protein n=1 Tax=Streptomyces griseofuscus TaxID=146922 RepID=UPI0033E7DC6F
MGSGRTAVRLFTMPPGLFPAPVRCATCQGRRLDAVAEAVTYFSTLMGDLARLRRGSPADDVTTTLVRATVDGRLLTTPNSARSCASCWSAATAPPAAPWPTCCTR